MRLPCLFASLATLLLLLSGCRSAFIDATISNHTPDVLRLIEVDYPSASFGTENLASGKNFHYRFKILGEGPTKIIYTDSSHHEKQAAGPRLKEGTSGSFLITISPEGVRWEAPSGKH